MEIARRAMGVIRFVVLSALAAGTSLVACDAGDAGKALWNGRTPDAGKADDASSGGSMPSSCNSDRVCTPFGKLCDLISARCVSCRSDPDCSPGKKCRNGNCDAPVSCRNSVDCVSAPDDRVICDMNVHDCVQCLTTVDCTGGRTCVGSSCIEPVGAGGATGTGGGEQGGMSSGAGGRTGTGGTTPSDGGAQPGGGGTPPATGGTPPATGGTPPGSGGRPPVTSCTDKVRNGSETDVDCGGADCPPCAQGNACVSGSDCASASCQSGHCVAPQAGCTNKVFDPGETDVDCGGKQCPKCAPGKVCMVAADCTSSVCATLSSTCATPTCTDTVKNGDEVGTDCGGSKCPKCPDGTRCTADIDCVNGACRDGVCRPKSCVDQTKNNGETDVDCGGSTCQKCATGKACTMGSDCRDGICTGNACQAPSCADGVKNGSETGTDCAGSCPMKCTYGKGCATTADCAEGECVGGSCRKRCVNTDSSGCPTGCLSLLGGTGNLCCRADGYCGCGVFGTACVL